MEIVEEKILELVEDYNFSEKRIRVYLSTLLEYPFVANGDVEKLLLCLERIVADRYSQSLIIDINKSRSSVLQRSLSETFSEMIFRTYGEEAFSYLNEEFLSNRRINIYPEYNDYEDTISNEEIEYQGYNK